MGKARALRLIEISGLPHERGRAYGASAAPEIHRAISHYAAQLKSLNLSDTDLSSLVQRYLPTIEAFEPRFVEEMRGIAVGARADFAHIVMINARTELLQLAADGALRGQFLRSIEADGCTTIAVEPDAAADGQLIHAHNWDWKLESADASVVLRIRDADGPDILTFTEAGALGRFGLNSAGIAITANYLESDRDYTQLGVPLAVIRRKVLEQTNLSRAVEVICNTPKSGSNNITVSHASSGLVFDFECAPDEFFTVEPVAGVLVHTNHWCSPVARVKLKEKGIASTPDTLYRDRRVRQLLARRLERLTVADAKRVLLDDLDAPASVCRPPGALPTRNSHPTVITLVMQPAKGIMEIAVLPSIDPTFACYALNPEEKADIGALTGISADD